jgi:pantetheine-phosphate adenylyltransferase
MTVALYPGSFDPATNGHIDTVMRASQLFEQVVVGVFDRPAKQLLFSAAERVALLQESVQGLPGVRIVSYNCLTVDYAREIGASVIVRGLRDVTDFQTEFQMAQINQSIGVDVEVVFFMANRKFTFLSSSAVREIAALGGDIREFVPRHIADALYAKFGRGG